VLTVKLAGSRRVVGVRMIPANNLHIIFPSGRFSASDIIRGNHEAVSRRLSIAVSKRKKFENLARHFLILSNLRPILLYFGIPA